MAVKSTYGYVSGVGRAIFKDPVTDPGKMKKSAVGLIKVTMENGKFVMHDKQTDLACPDCHMEEVFRDSKLIRKHTLSEIRTRVRSKPQTRSKSVPETVPA